MERSGVRRSEKLLYDIFFLLAKEDIQWLWWDFFNGLKLIFVPLKWFNCVLRGEIKFSIMFSCDGLAERFEKYKRGKKVFFPSQKIWPVAMNVVELRSCVSRRWWMSSRKYILIFLDIQQPAEAATTTASVKEEKSGVRQMINCR